MSTLRPVRGWIPPHRWPTRQEFALHAARMARANAVEAFVPTTLGTPTILDQDLGAPDGTGACFGFAFVGGVHIARQVLGIQSEILSPMVPYWAGRRESTQADSDVTDSGIDPDSMIAAANSFGACDMASAPWDPAHINDRPSDTAMLAAQQLHCAIEPILATGNDLVIACKHVLQVERLPVLAALDVVPSFDSPEPGGIVDDPSGKSRGGHAQMWFGFDDVGFLDAGSWGLSDGVQGIKKLTPRFVSNRVMWAGALRVQP
jgi:hypothetical protein